MEIEARIVGTETNAPAKVFQLLPGQSVRLVTNESGTDFTIENPIELVRYQHPQFEYDPDKRIAYVEPDRSEGQKISPTKHRVLMPLIRDTNALVSTRTLCKAGWPNITDEDLEVTQQYLRLYIRYLREGLNISDYLINVWGEGYRLENPLFE